MLKSRLSAGLYLALVFASGALVGGFSHRFYVSRRPVPSASTRTPEEWRRLYIDEMRKKVGLDASQVQQLQQILDETRQRFREQREKDRAAAMAIQNDQVEKIRAILRPDQEKPYAELRAERERRRQEYEKKKGPSRR
jgi:hypothetical protein